MKKILSIFTLAGITTFGLFAFMAFLVSSDQVAILKGDPTVIIDIVALPDESKPEIVVRNPLQPPEPPPAMETDRLPPTVAEVSTAFTYTPSDMNIKSVNTDTMLMGNQSDQDARPVVRVNPKYPMGALRNGVQGWVKLVFDISEIGEVINVKVLDSEPKRVFDKAAKQALRKWKYRAKSIDGKQVQQKNFTVQLDFNMEQQI